MSTPSAILTRLRAAGVTVAAVDGELKLKGPRSALNSLVLEELRANKQALLKLLTRTVDELAAAEFEERATPLPLAVEDAAARIEGWLCAIDQLPKACGMQGRRLKH